MDQKASEGTGQRALNFKCTKILHGVDKQITCQTPDKTTEPLSTKSKEGQIQLPEKYRTIADLFDHVSCSLRLLNLRKKSPTFQNICTQVEVLAKRKFSYPHLAQMKYILPEAIHIDKILVHDKKSLCMKPDLKITLTFEVVEGNTSESAYLSLRKLFGSRLIDFFTTRPEATDVPEAILPEPFSRSTPGLISDSVDFPVDSSTVLSQSSDEIQLLSEKFHPYPSFGRHFSQKNVASRTEKVQCLSAQTALSSSASDCLNNEESDSRWQEGCTLHLKSDATTNEDIEQRQQEESYSMCFQPSVINTPAQQICPPHCLGTSSSESPNIRFASTTDSLMTATPAQSEPRRLTSSSDIKVTRTNQKSASCYKPAKRVLDFSHMEGDTDALDPSENKLESSRVVNDNLPDASQGAYVRCEASGSVVLPQEVEEILGCSHEKTNQRQAGLATEQQICSSLIDLVDVIRSVFCSVKFSPITKSELLHKILMNSLDYIEIREVEERVEILEKVVPDWIFKKLVPTGDVMYCIKKVSDLDSVRSNICSNITMGAE